MSRRSSANNAHWIKASLAPVASLATSLAAFAGDTPTEPSVATDVVEAYVKGMWPEVQPGWDSRLVQDETQSACSRYRNNPPDAEANAIMERETKSIVYPADGAVIGDWKEGEKIAQNGRGGQFSDKPDTVNGGNCYACHQLAKSELAFGTLGPSLSEYGKLREFSPDAAKAAYAKIYNAQSTFACSNMPRFGAHKFLTEQQIKDVVAYLFDPDSPVNK
jgi:sulfur-oxidizing protein SoxX